MRSAVVTILLAVPLLSGSACADGGPVAAGAVCGTRAGIACEAGLWCDPEPGRCGERDLPGSCVAVPGVCIDLYQPVCGCDGKTYSNDCQRRAMQVQKDHDGACTGNAGSGK